MAQSEQPQYTYSKRRQSIKVHVLLFLTTVGIGNYFYARWAKSGVAARYEW